MLIQWPSFKNVIEKNACWNYVLKRCLFFLLVGTRCRPWAALENTPSVFVVKSAALCVNSEHPNYNQGQCVCRLSGREFCSSIWKFVSSQFSWDTWCIQAVYSASCTLYYTLHLCDTKLLACLVWYWKMFETLYCFMNLFLLPADVLIQCKQLYKDQFIVCFQCDIIHYKPLRQ